MLPGGSHDSLQMLIYGLWARRSFRLTRRRSQPAGYSWVMAPSSPSVPLTVDDDGVGKARMLQDIELMQELDPYGRTGIEEVFSPCHRENVCRQCKYQGICPDSRSGIGPETNIRLVDGSAIAGVTCRRVDVHCAVRPPELRVGVQQAAPSAWRRRGAVAVRVVRDSGPW